MSDKSKGRVLVAMSGGVDSSVAAALLVEQGYEVIGATMQVWDYSSCDIDEGNGTCCSSLDVDDARAVADKIGIPFYVLNCEAKFKKAVIDPFIEAYLKGKTPLPCVDCNTFLKFDHLIQKMKELECDYLATGHYAQILPDKKGEPSIQTSEDSWKDQTYFLFTLNKEILPRLLFPVGHLTKPEVRAYAEKAGLVVAKKKDSTGICFVGDKGYDKFMEEHVPAEVLAKRRGFIKRFPTGQTMAEHTGIHRFTYGQSRGLGMDHHEKLFVIKIDSSNNTVWVGDEKYLFRNELEVENPHWLHEIGNGESLNVKIRYAHKASPATVFKQGDRLRVVFQDPQRAVTPGQAAVFYKDKQLMGGGWIV
jgi:tRNA-specific 2-thiouridylase